MMSPPHSSIFSPGVPASMPRPLFMLLTPAILTRLLGAPVPPMPSLPSPSRPATSDQQQRCSGKEATEFKNREPKNRESSHRETKTREPDPHQEPIRLPMTKKAQAKACEKTQQGDKFFEAGVYSKAKLAYTLAIAENFHSAVLTTKRARCSVHLRDWMSAAQDCRRAIELDPRYDEAHNCLGAAWYGAEAYFKALESYRQAIKLNPGDEVAVEACKHILANHSKEVARATLESAMASLRLKNGTAEVLTKKQIRNQKKREKAKNKRK